MVTRILIIGGYGNFGSYITERLSAEPNISVIIAGRNKENAERFITSLGHQANTIETIELDYRRDLLEKLKQVQPDLVIHTSGPFQDQDYGVAKACIRFGCHYVDLADAREFVVGITELNEDAEKANVRVVSGASSVPCLTSALLDYYHDKLKSVRSVDYGIATAQQTNRGLATTSAVLSYAGKPIETRIDGRSQTVFGWQDIKFRKLPGIGYRTFANCEVPDLELFPDRYPDLETIRFFAGLEVLPIHFGLWLMTWLVRIRLISNLSSLAPILLKLSRLFDLFGSDVSGFYMEIESVSKSGAKSVITFNLIAKSGDGPLIPCAPAIILAKQLANGAAVKPGAQPCVGLIPLDVYLNELRDLDIKWEDNLNE